VIGEGGETRQRERIFDDETAFREAGELAERVDGASPPVKSRPEPEVFSEAGAAALLSPEMARREAPTFTEEFDTALQDEVGISLDDIF